MTAIEALKAVRKFLCQEYRLGYDEAIDEVDRLLKLEGDEPQQGLLFGANP